MIIDLNNLTIEQNILFDRIFNSTKREYLKLIDDIYLKSDKSIYFILSSATSRDIYLNNTLIKLTQISFIKHCLQKNNLRKIIIYDKHIKKIVSSLIRVSEGDTKLLCKYNYFDIFLDIIKGLISFLNNFKTIYLFYKSKSSKRLNSISNVKDIILINTMFIPSMFKNNNYNDRYYPKLFELAKNKDKIYFYPMSLLEIKLTKSLRICQKDSKNFIYCFDLLKLFDYFHALFSSFCLFKYKINNIYFNEIDVSKIINYEIMKNIFNQTLFQPMLNYLFVMRLREKNIDVKLFIDWFENQQLSRGFNISKSKYFPHSKSIGYQGWIVSDNFYYFHKPSKFELMIGSIPDKIAVIGKGLVQSFSKYSDISVITAPAFRYHHLYDNKIEEFKGKSILISLPISVRVANYLLKFCASSFLLEYFENVVVNYHPALNIKLLKNTAQFAFTDKKFNEIIKKSGIVISNLSGVGMESLALGVPVIVINGGSSINQNPIPMNIERKIWDECDNQRDFKKIFQKLYIEKNRNEQIKIAEVVREDYFEPVNEVSVNRFLDSSN